MDAGRTMITTTIIIIILIGGLIPKAPRSVAAQAAQAKTILPRACRTLPSRRLSTPGW
jgi:hypothetical protein